MQNAFVVGLPHSRSWGFQPRRRIWVCRNLTSTDKQKLAPNLAQMLKPSRKRSFPSALSLLQYQAKEEASLNTHFFIIFIHFLLHFSNNGDSTELLFRRISASLMVFKDIGHHSLPRYASLFSYIIGCFCHLLISFLLNSKAHSMENQDAGLFNYYL